MDKFPRSVCEQLGYYVYTLADPRNNKVFYIGKGKGNRLFQHASDTLRNTVPSDKMSRIRKIRSARRKVRYEVIRHGMTEDVALQVEAALIDFAGLTDLANVLAGHDVAERGRMNIRDVIAAYRREELEISENVVIIIVNRLYRYRMSAEELYEITRGDWRMGKRRNKAGYAMSVYGGLVREIYKIDRWRYVGAVQRWRFEGRVALNLRKYVGGSVKRLLGNGRKEFRYVNC